LLLSGTDRAVLARCPSELEARTGLGIAVAVPTVLAALGGTVALVNLSVSTPVAVAGGLVVAGVVGAVDRLMVTSPTTAVSMATRVVISLGLAWLIGEQLLLAAFASEVDAELAAIHADELTDAATAINTTADQDLARIDGRLAELDTTETATTAADTLAEAEEDLAAELADLEALQAALAAEIAGDSGSGHAGDGPAADAKRAEIAVAETAVAEATTRRDRATDALTATTTSPDDTTEIDALRAQRLAVEASRAEDLDAAEQRIERADGIIARIEALEHLGRSPLMAAQIWALRLLLLAIDTLPLTVKLAYQHRPLRPYDTTAQALAALEIHRAEHLHPTPTPSAAGPARPTPKPAKAKTKTKPRPAPAVETDREVPAVGTGREVLAVGSGFGRRLPADASADQVRSRIAELIDQGHTNTTDIARLIGRAPRTVRTHRQALNGHARGPA
jgi:hypothetical protein